MLNSAYLEETLVEILNDLISSRLAQRQFLMNRAASLGYLESQWIDG